MSEYSSLTRSLAVTLAATLLFATLTVPAQDPPAGEHASSAPAAPAEPPPPEPDPPDAELVAELEQALSTSEEPRNLVALLREANRVVWKHVEAGETYPRERFFPFNVARVDDHSSALAQRFANEKIFASPVRFYLRFDELHEQDEGLRVEGTVTWRQRALHEYFDAADRARLGKLNRAIAVVRKELRALKEDSGRKPNRGRAAAVDEVDEEIKELLRELIRQVGGEVPGESEPENALALRELQLEEAQAEVREIYAAARQRKEYSETTRITAFVVPRPGRDPDLARLMRTKRVKLQGIVSEGLIGRPFLLTDKPFIRQIVVVARSVDPP